MTTIIVDYRPGLHIANASALPHGLGCKYLECIMSHSGSFVAKAWHRKMPKGADIVVRFRGRNP